MGEHRGPRGRSAVSEQRGSAADVIEAHRDAIEKTAWRECSAAVKPDGRSRRRAEYRRVISSAVDMVVRFLRTGDMADVGEHFRQTVAAGPQDLPLKELEGCLCSVLCGVVETIEQTLEAPASRAEVLKAVCSLMHRVAMNSAEARAVRQTRLLLDAAKLLTSTLDLDEVLHRVGALAAGITLADYSALFLPDEVGERLYMQELHSVGGEVVDGLVERFQRLFGETGMRYGQGAVGKVFVTGEPLIVRDYAEFPGHLKELLPELRSMLVVPMKLRDRPIGVFSLYSLRVGAFSEEDLSLAVGVADQAAIAVENAKVYKRERNIAETLQRSFLPVSVPLVPGYEVATRYKAALEESEVGGDFYDLFTLPDGRLALVIADVAGKGLSAAIHTAMGKYVLRAYAFEDASPGQVLQRCNRTLNKYLPTGMFITGFYGLLDPKENVLTYANAGHTPPVFYSTSPSHTTFLDVTGPGLGGFPEVRYGERRLAMKPGDLMVLYTDGAVDVKKGDRFLEVAGLERLVWANVTESADQAAGRIFKGILEFSGGRLTDDVALVLVKKQT